MRSKYTPLALCLTSSIALGLSARVQATPVTPSPQTSQSDNAQANPKAVAPANPKAAAPANPKAATNLPTIMVTATRRSESIQDVPGAVTSLTGSFLDQIHANSFEQFAGFVPGLSFSSLGPTSDIIAIRGVTTGGTQLSSGIGMYFDQVPIGASTPNGVGFQTIPINTFDLSRVEVLNGPQGTLYGANALGGAIKYVPTSPNLNDFGAVGSTTLSSTAHAGINYGVNAMFNLPLAPGKVALRVDGVQQYDTGFGHNTLLGIDNQGSAHTTMGRAQLLAQVTPDLSVKLSAFSQKIRGNGLNVDFRDIATGQPTLGTYEQAFALHQPESNSLQTYSGTIDWNLHWATFTSITAYQDNNGKYLTDLSDLYNVVFHEFYGFPLSVYGLYVDTTTRKTTQEFRLESPQGQRIEWLLGAYASHETTHEFIDLQNSPDPQGLLFGFSPFYGVLPSLYKETSAFADGTFHFTDRFDVTLGARYSRNSQRYQQFANGWLVVPAAPGLTTHEDATSKQSVTTWLLNPRYHITKDFMVYAKVASGYRPGGPNFVLQLGQGAPTFKPDKLWNYEIGEKATLLDGRATLNADLYDIRWSRIQLTVNNGGINQIENGGSARIKGAEVSAAWKVTPHFTLTGSGGWTDAKLTSAVPALGLLHSGARLPFSPKYNVALSGTWNFNVGRQSTANLTVSDVYVGGRTAGYRSSAIAPYYRLPGYNTTNLDLAIFAPHNIEVDVFLHNAFDKAGQVSATTVANEYDPFAPVPVVLSSPRTIGVRVTIALGNPY
ncbi:MAG: TonB-dependent receptor [Rhodanobacter sp.]|nr:MAG: TonB-dependent receptor [Rhodanobacter sp.]TAL90267.1 MAG: TonB-dependent receptor [Rhodanobacter sp.]TAM43093.1 MAG: TonB-dependent receptor [Rhodanobacter sp.]